MEDREIRFTVKLDREYGLSLDEDLNIDKADINTELAQQPSLFAWYATLNEMARYKAKNLRQKLKVAQNDLKAKYAELSLSIRREGANVKLTEATVDALVQEEDDYKSYLLVCDDLERKCIEAERDEGLLYVAKEAFQQRKDALMSISANMRGEKDGDLHILAKDNVRSKVEELKKKATKKED